MGNVCHECTTHEEEFESVINVSRANFAEVEPKEEIIQEIKELIHGELPEEFKNYSFFQKGEDCYFVGQIVENEEEKYGLLFKPNETLYYGYFVNGLFNGKGVLKLIKHKITFEGEFNQGRPVEKGKITDENHTFEFNGIWNNQFQPKSGTLRLYEDKLIHHIDFIDFERGNVEILYKNGSVYKGFINKETLMPEGIGKMNYPSGNVYDGEWVQGKFEGVGVYTWKNGQSYNGEYKNGLRHGEGTLTFSKNKYFIGYWKNGHREGFGKLMELDGVILEKGVYKNDKFDYETTEAYLDNFMAKAPKDGVVSELLSEEEKDDLSIEGKMSHN